MKFAALMKKVKSMFESWKTDETLIEHYSTEELQKEFLKCIQGEIGSDFVIMTKEELERDRMMFHECMEGTYIGDNQSLNNSRSWLYISQQNKQGYVRIYVHNANSINVDKTDNNCSSSNFQKTET